MGLWYRSNVEIETLGQGEGRIGTRHDWVLKDYTTGEVIRGATRYVLFFNFCHSEFLRYNYRNY